MIDSVDQWTGEIFKSFADQALQEVDSVLKSVAAAHRPPSLSIIGKAMAENSARTASGISPIARPRGLYSPFDPFQSQD